MDREMNELTPELQPWSPGVYRVVSSLHATTHKICTVNDLRRLLESPLYSTLIGLRHVIPPTTSSAEATTFATIQ